jgi:hypothetical protein
MYHVDQNEDAARLSQHTKITPLQHTGHDATSVTNKLVEAFYERDNIQLLDQLGLEQESTRLHYDDIRGRVDSSMVYFYEYFGPLIEAVREHVRTTLARSSTVSWMTSWPDSRVKERELYEKVWSFERWRWDQYILLSSWTEPF